MENEIIEKAKQLNLDTTGETTEEKLRRIASQVGFNNFNLNDSNLLNDKINSLYNTHLSNGIDNRINNPSDLSNNIRTNITNSNINPNTLSHRMNSQFKKNLINQNNKNNEIIKNRNNQIVSYNRQRLHNNSVKSENEDKSSEVSQQKSTKKGLNLLNKSPFSANSLKKKVAETTVNGSVDLIGIIKKHVPTIGITLLFFLTIVLLLLIVSFSSQDDESELSNEPRVTGYITGNNDFDDLSDSLVYNDICSSDDNREKEIENCLNSPAGQYFTHIKNLYNQYKTYTDKNGTPIELDVNLILETISYGVTDMELFDEKNLSNIIERANKLALAQVEEYQEYGDLYTLKNNSCNLKENQVVLDANERTSYYRISNDKYVSYLLYGEVHENYKGNVKKYDVDIHPLSEGNCIPEGRSYSGITEVNNGTTYSGNDVDGYIYQVISKEYNVSASKLNNTNQEIVKKIYERAKSSYNSSSLESSIICPGIVVTGDYAGVYPLEEYIAGVITNENNWYQGSNIENMKSQAVAARTYALRATSNCTQSIENSQSKQTFTTNYSEQAIRAANETANMVLVNDAGNYISTEYDALAVKEITSDYYVLKQANLEIPINWVRENISEANLNYYEKHNHGRGMSQWGSRYLQTIGYTYDKILSTFYSNGKLITLGNSITSNIPNNLNDLKNRYYFNFDINVYQGNRLFGQCVWYAKHRAMEILASSNLDDASKKTLIQSINYTSGDGQDWFKNPNSSLFKKSTDINSPKAGSIVSWTRGQYGHVAIIEAVYTSSSGEVMVTLTDGWRTRGADGGWYITNDVWSVANFRKKDLTLNELKTFGGNFNGYVYLY